LEHAIGNILPSAIGIAISPVPMIAAVLMLLSPRARGTSLGFLGGWLVGIVAAVVAFTLLGNVIPDGDPDASHPTRGVVLLLLGILLVLLAVRQVRSRESEPTMPAWMAAVDKMTVGRGALLAFLLAAVNPKNLAMAAAAGVDISAADLEAGAVAGTVVVFALVAASSVAVPVVAYLANPRAMAGPLTRLKDWLVANNATVMAVLFLVIGVTVIGKGIGSF
jgi:hypothetical protein